MAGRKPLGDGKGYRYDPNQEPKGRERVACDAYVRTLNKRKALAEAGYKDTDSPRFFYKPHVRKYIAERIAERTTPIGELIERLDRIANADISEFIDDSSMAISLRDIKKSDLSFLIKEVQFGRGGMRVKLHDSHKAIVDLLTLAGKFATPTNVGEELQKEALRLAKWEAELTQEKMRLLNGGSDEKKAE